METAINFAQEGENYSFNFLASLINGNVKDFFRNHFFVRVPSFNFLASLINGNEALGVNSLFYNGTLTTFNFLASLINGNRYAAALVLAVGGQLFLLTS